MSVVQIKEGEAAPPSGGVMDRLVARKRMPPRLLLAAGIGLALLAALAFHLWAPSADSQTIDSARLTVSTVTRGRFDDFLPLRARVTPSETVYLDAVEGGRVERVLVEDGAIVQQGQLLAVLSNPELQLNVLAREAEVVQQVTLMHNQELALAQTGMQDRRAIIDADLATQTARRQFEAQRPLAERGFVAGHTFADTRDTYEANRRRSAVLRETQATDQRLQSTQLGQIRHSVGSLSASLGIARGSLDSLNLRAPVSGQLTAFSIRVGQSMNRGDRIGQLDSAGHNKLNADVDEFYLGRVQVGQTATADYGGHSYRMRVSKIYPQVTNGQFQVDLVFLGEEPHDVQRGQTLQVRLTLGDPTPATLVPSGGFYSDTGGSWVFVVAPDGASAVKRQVRLGRRNPDFVEVLDGLSPGDRVITSSYSGFADRDRLDLR